MKTTRKEAISAVKTLLGYIEDDVEREMFSLFVSFSFNKS